MKRLFTLFFLFLIAITANAATPTVPATNLLSTTIEGNSITFSWTNGNGASRIVIARKDNPVTALPVNGTDYFANNIFGQGNEISPGQFVIYKDNGSQVGLTGLLPNAVYYIAIFEFNGSSFSTEYLTASFLSGSRTTSAPPAIQVSNFNISNVTGNSMKLNFTAGNGASRLILAKAGSPVNANPLDLNNYFSNSEFGIGSQIGSGNYVVAKGGTTVTVTGLEPNTTYHFAGFEFNGSVGPVYLTLSPAIISQLTAPAPTIPSSNLTYTNIEGNSIVFTWTPGNGARRIVIGRAGSAVTAVPTNGASYTANSIFGSGQQIAPNQFVLYNGNGSGMTLSGLQHGTTYHFAIFEYDGTGTNTSYFTSSFLSGNQSTVSMPSVPASNLSISNSTSNTITLNWTNGNGTSRMVLARQGSPVNALPVNYTTYMASAYGSGSQVGSGNWVVYQGSGNSATISGLSFNTNYHFAVVEMSGSSAPVYLTTNPPVINGSTSSAPTIPASSLYFNSTEGNSMAFGCNAGNGTGRIMVAKAGSPVTGLPVNGVSYTANSSFGSGATIAPGEFVISSGAGSNVGLTNLTIGTTYYFAIFEYNGTGANTAYLTSSFLSGNRTTLAAPTVQTASMSFSNIVGNAMQVTLSPGNGQSRLVLIKEGSPVNASPVNFSSYSSNAAFGVGSQIGTGNYVVNAGGQNNFTVTGLQPNTTYHFAAFEFNGSSGPVYNTINPATSNSVTLPRPTIAAFNMSFVYVEGNNMQLNWQPGNGTRRIVIARQGSPVTAVPADGVTYTGNSVFGSGSEISPGQFVIANTNNTSASITNLAIGTTYHFAIFEYDGIGSNTGYLVSSFLAGSRATVSAPTVQTSNLLFTNITNSTITLNWTNGNGSNRIVIVKPVSAVNAVPVDLVAYFTSVNIQSAGQVAPGNYSVFTGTSSTTTVYGLQPNTTYHFAIYEFNGSSAPVYMLSSPVTGNATTVGPPQVQATNAVANAINSTAATLNWTNGDGLKRIVLMKANAPVDAVPVNDVSYTANTFFGSGTQIGSANYTVFNGTGNNVTVTNLNLSNTYHIAVFEFNEYGLVTKLYFTVNPARAIVTLSAPQVQATNAAANPVTMTTADINWSNGNGHKRIVLMKANAPVDASPADGMSYTANTAFGSGSQLGSGNYVVHNGTANAITVSNLNSGSTYHVAVFEYNDFGGTLTRYQVTNPSRTTVVFGPPQTQSSSAIANVINNTSAIIGWTNGSGHKRIVLMKANAAVDANPVDGTTYTANSSFGAGTQLGSGNYTIYNGTGNNVTVTNLNAVNTYHIAVFEYNDFGGVTKWYLTVNPARATVVFSALPVTFIDFTAKKVTNKVLLEWSTAQEFNSARFDIERSANGTVFEKIGSVAAAGSSSIRTDYTYTDNTTLPGKYFYRLKQVDTDGNFIFSKIVSVTIKDNGGFRLLGNPVKNELQLAIDQPAQQPFTIRIFNSEGKQVLQQTMKNQSLARIDISKLSAGIYIVELVATNSRSHASFMKTP